MNKIKGLIVFGVVFVVLLIVGAIFLQRVEPGKVGVLIDYAKGSKTGQPAITPVSTGSWKFVGPLQRLAEYDMSQQAQTMVKAADEGRVQGDDSVSCRDKTGIQLNIDATVLWKVDTSNIGPLYLLYPDKNLTSIGDDVVRRITRTVMNDVCGQYAYGDIYGTLREEYGQKVQDKLTERLASTFVIVQSFNMGEVYLQSAQQEAVTAKSVAEQQAQEAKFLAEKKTNEAAGAVAEAEGAKLVTILEAEAQAEAIRVINEMLADSPDYLEYLKTTQWNGVLPTTMVFPNGTNFSLFAPITQSTTVPTP